jgi:DNA-binding HxlR family transcriptional regulator
MVDGHGPLPRSSWETAGTRLSPDELDERIRRFTEAATQFSREFTTVAGPLFGRESARSSALNVGLAKSLFSKWVIEILLLLFATGEIGFQDLRRELRTISPRVLSQKLRLLEERDLVRRTILATRPARVHYSLTDDGLYLAKLGEPVFIFLRYRRARRPAGRRTASLPRPEARLRAPSSGPPGPP